MRTRSDISVFAHEQATKAEWGQARSFADAWTATKQSRFTEVVPGILRISFDDVDDEEYKELVSTLTSAPFSYQESTERIFDDSDFSSADAVHVIGVGLDDDAGSFVLNGAAALGAPVPCPACGWVDDWSCPQLARFIVDESRLTASTHMLEGPRAGPAAGWDFVNLPGGRMAVSARVSALLSSLGAGGYKLSPINTSSGEESERLFQLSATPVMPEPCLEHTRIDPPRVCRQCGTLYGQLAGLRFYDEGMLQGLDVFSTHPNASSCIHLRRRVFGALVQEGAEGMVPLEPVRFCSHTPKGDG